MELIPYEDFAALRLADFAANPAEIQHLDDWEFLDYRWVGEALGLSEWLRPIASPEELRALSLDFLDLPYGVTQQVLAALNLPLRPGMDLSTVSGILGEPLRIWQVTPGQVSYEFLVGIAWPYRVDCTIREDAGLTYVTVIAEG
jgi:hypothetical protein